VSWTDDTRIPFVNEVDLDNACNKNHQQGKYNTDFFESYYKRKGSDTKGRFTPNLLVCDDMLNDGRITKTTASKGHIRKGNVLGDTRTPVAAGQFGDGAWIEGTNINDKGSSSRFYDLDLWFNKVIDEIR
jgi:hypothetical protein